MFRRRQRTKRETFSLDSFLDLVTNIVGIIIRLILVAWVGARSYNNLPQLLKQFQPPATEPVPEVQAKDDPLSDELERQRQEMAEAQARLLDQLRQLDLLKEDHSKAQTELTKIEVDRKHLLVSEADLEQAKKSNESKYRDAALSFAELEKRRQRLTVELKELEKLPPLKKTLRYRTPVSQTVAAGESHFECRGGRVTFVNLDVMLHIVEEGLRDKEKLLESQWSVSDVTEPVGAFQMRYVIERRRSAMDALGNVGSPANYASFSYGLTEWQVEPIDSTRGETAAKALADGSDFRHLIDGLAVEKAAVTFWVYPDSFPLYRQLRDYLADRGVTVAGRPLPEGSHIGGSPRGKKSRGQ